MRSFIMVVGVAGSTVAYSDASSNEDEACTDTTCGTTGGRQFGKEAHDILENFYARGMTGWGAKHAAELEVVQSTTNLTLAQIKVSFFLLLMRFWLSNCKCQL